MNWFLKRSLSLRIMGALGATFLITSILNILWIGQLQKDQAREAAQELAAKIADTTLSGLNNMMVVGVMEERSGLIRMIGQMEGVNDIRVIRGDTVNKMYGEGFPEERPQTDLDREVLSSGKPRYRYADGELQAVVPFLMQKNWRGVNCHDCHEANEGDAIGALAMNISLEKVESRVAANNMMLGIFFLIEGLGLLAVSYFAIARKVSQEVRNVAEMLQTGSEEVAAAAQHINDSSHSMSRSATSLNDSVEATSDSLKVVTELITTSSSNTRKVDDLMKQVTLLVKEGSASMERTVSAMASIKQSSEKIGDIIRLIEDIAFQTNLLALNAAVEAARAGESGKGFSVVAEEVRSLAQRSASAARDINGFIETANKASDNGAAIVEETGASLVRIQNAVEEVDGYVIKMTDNADRQNERVEGVNQNMTTLNSVSQDASSSAEMTAAASDELSAQAVSLNHLVKTLEDLVSGHP